jgi:hypothetical protein
MPRAPPVMMMFLLLGVGILVDIALVQDFTLQRTVWN